MDKKIVHYTLLGTAAMALGLASYPSLAVTEVGKVIQSVGDFSARQPDQGQRPLRRRSPINLSDTLVTGSGARAQVRFIDNALVEFQPGSEFKVDSYNFDAGDSTKSSAVATLLKGGMRTISGAIGKQDPKNVAIKTPVGSIGIRGTHYGVRICDGDCGNNKDGLYVGIVDGRIVFSNDAGTFEFGKDRYFYVPGPGQPPQPMLAPPGVIFAGVQGQEGESEGVEGSEGDSGGYFSTGFIPPEDNYVAPPEVDLTYQSTSQTPTTPTGTVVAPMGSAFLGAFLTPSSLAGSDTGGSGGFLIDGVTTSGLLDSASGVPVYGVEMTADCGGLCTYDWLASPLLQDNTVTEVTSWTAGTTVPVSVTWGRWGGGGLVTDLSTGSETVLAGTATLAYVDPQSITPYTRLTDGSLGAIYGSTSYSLIDGTAADAAGNPLSGSMYMDVNFVTQEFTGASAYFTPGGSDFYSVSLVSPVSFQQAYAVGHMDVSGSTNVGGGGTLTGTISGVFIGPNAEGIAGSLGATCPSCSTPTGVTAVGVLEENGGA